MQYRFRHTLISLMLVLAIAPALLVSAYLLVQINDQAKAQGVMQLHRESRSFSIELEHALSQLQSHLSRLNQSESGISLPPGAGLTRQTESQMTELQESFPVIDALVLIDQTDSLIAGVPQSSMGLLNDLIENRLSDADRLSDASTAQLNHVDLPELATLSGRLDQADYLVFTQPITPAIPATNQTGTPAGNLLVAINIHALLKQLAAQTTTDLSRTQLILQQDRETIYSSQYTTEDDAASSSERVLAGLNTAPLQMTLTMKQDWSTIHSGTNASLRTFLWLLVVLLAVITAAIFLISHRLTRPIAQLQQVIRTLAKGRRNAVQSTLNFKEFQDLSDQLLDAGLSVQRQLDTVQTAKSALESDLLARAEELQASHAKLNSYEQLVHSVMQLTLEIQKSDSIDSLIDCTLDEIKRYFHEHRCALLLNRTSQHEAHERSAGLSDRQQQHFLEQREHWCQQDFDFRTDAMGDDYWTLIPLRDSHRTVIGQLILLGREADGPERDSLIIVTRLISFMLDQIYLTRTIERQANTDALTGLANRLFFESQFQRLLQKHHEYGTGIGLIVVDVDGLKKVNDTYGHDYGDLLLQRVADKLQQVCRDSDILARVGGGEFYLLLNGADQKACQLAADRLNETSQSLTLLISTAVQSVQYPIQFTLGYASTEITDITSLVALAEQVMYQNKRD